MIDTLITDLYYAYGAWAKVPQFERTRLCLQWLKERDAYNDILDDPADCETLWDLLRECDYTGAGSQMKSMVHKAAIVQVRERWAEIERRTAA